METTPTLGALGKPFVGCMWAAPERRPWFWAPAGPPSQCRQYSRQLGAQVVVISRTGADNYENLDRHRDAAILINATPVGMYPDNGESPLALDRLPRLEAVFDLIYNPARTRLLLEAEGGAFLQRPHHAGGPGGQVLGQFTGQAISQSVQDTIVAQVGAEMENWVLIGMPGCGKTRIGQLLAQRTGRPFVDGDRELEVRSECPFRCSLAATGRRPSGDLEAQVLQDLGKGLGSSHRHRRWLRHPGGKLPIPTAKWENHLDSAAIEPPQHPGAASVTGNGPGRAFQSPPEPVCPLCRLHRLQCRYI